MSPDPFQSVQEREELEETIRDWLDRLAAIVAFPYRYGVPEVAPAASSNSILPPDLKPQASQKSLLELSIKIATARLEKTVAGDRLQSVYSPPAPGRLVSPLGDLVEISEIDPVVGRS